MCIRDRIKTRYVENLRALALAIPEIWMGRVVVRRLGLATINLYTKYEVSLLAHYEDMKGVEKCKNWGVLRG